MSLLQQQERDCQRYAGAGGRAREASRRASAQLGACLLTPLPPPPPPPAPGGPQDRASSVVSRTALRGAVVAFITAGYSGKRFVFEKAKELGVRAIILDGPDK